MNRSVAFSSILSFTSIFILKKEYKTMETFFGTKVSTGFFLPFTEKEDL